MKVSEEEAVSEEGGRVAREGDSGRMAREGDSGRVAREGESSEEILAKYRRAADCAPRRAERHDAHDAQAQDLERWLIDR